MVLDPIYRCLKTKKRTFRKEIRVISTISLLMAIFTCGAYASSGLDHADYISSQAQTYPVALEKGSDLKVDLDYKRAFIDFKSLNFSGSTSFTASLTGRNFSLKNGYHLTNKSKHWRVEAERDHKFHWQKRLYRI